MSFFLERGLGGRKGGGQGILCLFFILIKRTIGKIRGVFGFAYAASAVPWTGAALFILPYWWL